MYRLMFRFLACVFIFAAALSASGQTARISGQVTDPQNAAIPNAEVHVLNLDTSARTDAKTDTSGNYVVPYLTAGRYRVEVSAPGFTMVVSDNLVLTMGQAHILNIQLGIAAAQSTVNVNAGSEVTQVNTQNAEVSGTITSREVTTLQLNGRNFTQLMALAPGVSNQTQQDEASVGLAGSVAYSVNGGRTEYNSFQVDGSETLNVGINKDHSTLIVYPSVDAIQEIKVLTSNYGAEYPSTGNGTTIVTTKSGTDQYHGGVYEFLRNEDFNAKGYFDVGNKAPLYRRNDFGGTIGGPLPIPHLYDAKGRTHFFFSEEARIETSPTAYRQAVPSTAERNGDFSDVCPYAGPGQSVHVLATQYPDCPIPPGQTGSDFDLSFPGNQTTADIHPVAKALLNTGIFPYPNATSGCNSTGTSCYNADVSLPLYYREELFRIDHALNQKNSLTFRYIHDEYSNTVPYPEYGDIQNTLPTIVSKVYAPGTSLVARIASVISPRILNDFSVSYTNSHITFADAPQSAATVLQRPAALEDSTNGLGTIFNNGFGGKLPGVNIAGNNAEYGGTGFAVDPGYLPWEHTNPSYSVLENATWSRGRNTLQAGVQWNIYQRNQLNDAIGAASGDMQGLLTFSNQNSANSTGNAFANFLLWGNDGGGPSSFQQDSTQLKYYQRYQMVEPYLQDDWKVTSRLTVNLGVRVSLFGTYHEKNLNAYNWVPSSFQTGLEEQIGINSLTGMMYSTVDGSNVPIYSPNGQVDPRVINGIVQCGKNGVPNGCMSNHLWNPAPRVGVAWDPFGNGKTSIRAGYGIFYEHGTADEANTGSLEGSAPLVLSMTQLNPGLPNCIGTDGSCNASGTGAFPISVTAIPTKAVWPYIQQWSFGVERAVPGNTLASFSYVGSKGTHLTLERQLNQLDPPPQSINPFGPHDPLLQSTCGGAVSSKFGQGAIDSYTLPNGQVIGQLSPLFHNMEAACSGIGAGGTVNPVSLRTFAPGLNEIYSLENTANSTYNALQATLRRVSGPLTLGVAYTYSHSLDDSSDRSDSTFTNSFDVRSGRASSNFDQRHLLHISYIYDLPLRSVFQKFLSNINSDPDPENRTVNRPPSQFLTSRLEGFLLDHWELSGITLFETGIPFTVVNGGSANGVSVLDNAGVDNGVGAGSYPDLVGSPQGQHPKNTGGTSVGPLLLNPSAFAAPRGLTFGNAGRNVLNNPRRWNFDATMAKHFAVNDRIKVEFRAEAFNVFNHTQFRIYNPTLGNQANNTISCYAPEGSPYNYSAGDPGDGSDKGCLTGSSFLHPIDAHRPRTIQFGLKLAF